MKILILGGCGTQGRTAIYDLAQDPEVEEIICADLDFSPLDAIRSFTPMEKVRTTVLDARNKESLVSLYNAVDIVIDLLPKDFWDAVCDAALETKTSVLNTNYAGKMNDLDGKAKAAGIAIMPECGLDPGIDLVIYGDAHRRFETLTRIDSYCGGFPEEKACTNPIGYKLSWIWQGVLSALNREARVIRGGKVVEIPAADIYKESNVHPMDFPGLGTFEAYPNGDAVLFTDMLGVTDTITDTGRYSLRWPGWSAFWRPLKELGFTDTSPVEGIGCSPFDFLDKFLGPKLAYKEDEKDLVAMINIFEGIMDGQKTRMTSTMLIERDLDTGIMAMSKGVGYTAAIVARMIANGQIQDKGILSPVFHIPVAPFMAGLKARGIRINEQTVVLD